MKNKLSIHTQLTHQYRAGWSYLDEFVHVFDARITTAVVSQGEESSTARYILTLSPAQRLDAKKAFKKCQIRQRRTTFSQWMTYTIAASLSGSNCRHDYDCCGCITRNADAHQLAPREFAISIELTPNY